MKTHFIDSLHQKKMIILFPMLCERNSLTENHRFCPISMLEVMKINYCVIV